MRKSSLRVPLRYLYLERLEDRRTMTASLGWDGPGQGGANLTYYLGATQGEMSAEQFKSAIQTALRAWSDVANITFTQTDTPALRSSLDFTFRNIDGSGGTLAQAYFPDASNRSSIAGDVQFDTSENWEVGNSQGASAFDLVYVAVHEIGHALGLDHSSAVDSVMKESVSAMQSFSKLSSADVDAILAMYAPATTSSSANISSTTSDSGTDSQSGNGSGTSNSGGSAAPTTPANNPNCNWNKNKTNSGSSGDTGESTTGTTSGTTTGSNSANGRNCPTTTANSGSTNSAGTSNSGSGTDSGTNEPSTQFNHFTRGSFRQQRFRWSSGNESVLSYSGSRTNNTATTNTGSATTQKTNIATNQVTLTPQSLNSLIQAMRMFQILRRWF